MAVGRGVLVFGLGRAQRQVRTLTKIVPDVDLEEVAGVADYLAARKPPNLLGPWRLCGRERHRVGLRKRAVRGQPLQGFAILVE
jgi:hypothetical protein